MPSQTIQLQAAWYFPSFSRWKPPPGSRPAIDAGLRGADPRFLESIILADGEIRFRIASSQTEISDSGQDLTSQFEDHGSLELIVGANSLLVALGGADTTEPYVWTPTNTAEIAAFEALLSGTSGTESGQLIIRDFVPAFQAGDAGDVAWSFDLPQPTVTYTPPAATSTLTTSDWNSAGYQAPIVLALLPATISGADITVDPVTAIAGDLFVASDLTIDGVERYAAQDSIRLRKTGDGLFSTYFDNEGSPLYPDAKAFIVIDDQARTHVPFTIGSTGGGFNNWNYDTASQESLVEAIATGDRFLLAIAEPLSALAHAVDAGDVAWDFDLPEPTVTYTPAAAAHAVNAGDVAFDFAIPQPTVTYTPPSPVAQAVDAGDVAWAFDLPEPTVTYTPAGAQAVNAGDVAWTFDLPQPTVTYTPPPGAQAVDAGDVAWAFHIPQPTVTAGGVRPYTSLAQSAFAQETDEVWLILLTISHADLTNDIQVVHNPVAITSRGMTFVGFAFEISLPIDSPDRAPVAELRIDNVSQEIAQAVRSISSAPTVKIEVIRAAAPDVVELSLDGFRLRNVNWDADSVRGALVLDDIATEPYPAGIFSPAGFPGLT